MFKVIQVWCSNGMTISYFAVYARNRRVRLSALGLCVACGREPLVPGHARCRSCGGRMIERAKCFKDSRKETGVCINCGKVPPQAGHVLCYGCSVRNQECYRIRSARNVLLYGSTKLPNGRVMAAKYERDTRAYWRSLAIILYGGKCECCGESDPIKLTFDHINGNGKYYRSKGAKFYKNAVQMGRGAGILRLLCWNCNASLGDRGYCPHSGGPVKDISSRSTNRKVKMQTIQAYGGKCVMCGETIPEFLTIDHTNGGGKVDRGSRSGVAFYAQLRRTDFPKDDYQLLCFNCNCAKGVLDARMAKI